MQMVVGGGGEYYLGILLVHFFFGCMKQAWTISDLLSFLFIIREAAVAAAVKGKYALLVNAFAKNNNVKQNIITIELRLRLWLNLFKQALLQSFLTYKYI